MFKKLRDFFKSKKQKGQSMAFFAAAIPFLCLFVGASMDFGWMYYNQSRLQNAADAAARAGAKTLVGGQENAIGGVVNDEAPLSEYHLTQFVSNSDPGLLLMQEKSIISKKEKNQLKNNKPAAGDSIAKIYAEADLKGTKQDPSKAKVRLVEDDNIGVDSSGYENIKFESTLWGPNADDEDALFYTVTLSTKLQHLFGGIMENFGIAQLPSVATSAVKISYGEAGQPLYIQMKQREKHETYSSWEEVKVQNGNNATTANNRSVLTGGSYYSKGNFNRVEASLLSGNSFASSKGNPYKTGIDQTAFDDLFIDFQGEMNRNLTINGDEDLDPNTVSGNWDYWLSGNDLYNNTTKQHEQYYFRVHFPIMIVSKYAIRKGKQAPDPLYAFIEQEPIKQPVTLSDGTTYTRGNMSSVRQIIINNDIANTNEATDRPIVFFYEGPEIPYAPSTPDPNLTDKNKTRSPMSTEDWFKLLVEMKKQAHTDHPKYYDEDGDYIGERPFLPVIVNLYRDFRGIIFTPNNPVIINGNGKKFEGFVVAREFRRLKNYSDFQSARYADGSDKGTPIYVYPDVSTYKGVSNKNAPFYAHVSGWAKKPSATNEQWYDSGTKKYITSSTIVISGTTYRKATVKFNGNSYTGWVKQGQWYTKNDNPNINNHVEIYIDGDSNTKRFVKVIDDNYVNPTGNLLLEANLKLNSNGTTYDLVDSGGTAYVVRFDGRYYTPVTIETVTYTGGVDTITLGNFFASRDKTITQLVNTMYVSATKYKYTETYLNTEGKQKTKTTIMSIGDVQYVNVTASDSSLDADGNVTGEYTETPRNHGTFADDDKLRYDYVNVFNLASNSTYSSFRNVSLANYVYLKKTEKSTLDSHDMFFTTARSRHID